MHENETHSRALVAQQVCIIAGKVEESKALLDKADRANWLAMGSSLHCCALWGVGAINAKESAGKRS